jgi:SAM-dependent methyltransferase
LPRVTWLDAEGQVLFLSSRQLGGQMTAARWTRTTVNNPATGTRQPGGHVTARWYENFFQGIALEVWRKTATPEQTRAEVDCLERVLKLRANSRVLDVPCGFGRHSLELAARGFHVSAVDVSLDMLDEARHSAVDAGLEIEWRRADMRELPWDSAFDAVFCFGNSFGYLDVEDTQAFLRGVSRALKRGGRFALDSGMAAESVLPRLREREWAHVDDILFLEENRYDVADGCIETTYTFVRDGKAHTQSGLHWVYSVREIRRLLQEAGLQTRHVHGSLDGSAFQFTSPYLLLVSEKP